MVLKQLLELRSSKMKYAVADNYGLVDKVLFDHSEEAREHKTTIAGGRAEGCGKEAWCEAYDELHVVWLPESMEDIAHAHAMGKSMRKDSY
jgi:hypothetical protein